MDLGDHSEDDDDELYGLRGFSLLRRMRSLYERRRERVLFHGMLRDRNIDAIQILLKHVPLPQDAKKTAIPKIVPSSDTWDINVRSIKILLQILLKHGADIDGKDRRGRTALAKAVLAENVGLTSLLASKGASTSIVDDEGETPLSSALKIENKEIIDILNKQKLFARLASFPTRARSPRPNDATDGHSESKCVICYDRPAEVIFAPCGHKVVCKRDCRKLFEMPEEKRCCPLDKEKVHMYCLVFVHDFSSFYLIHCCRLRVLLSRYITSGLLHCHQLINAIHAKSHGIHGHGDISMRLNLSILRYKLSIEIYKCNNHRKKSSRDDTKSFDSKD